MITPPPTLKEKEKLYIKIAPQALKEWSVAAIIEAQGPQEQKILASHGKAREKIEIKNNAFFLTLDDFGPEGSEKVILILNHFSPPQKSQDTENIPSPSVTATFSIGDPPVLSSVHVVQDGKDIYKAEFAEKGAEKRELLITKDEILDLKKSAGLGEIHLKFSKILEKAPRIFLEEFEIENFKSSDGGKAWQAQINLDALKKSLKEPWPSQLNLIVSAKSSALLSLDPIPQTIAKISDAFAKTEGEEIKILWENYEKDEKERKDKIHFIRLSSGIVLRGKVLETTSHKPIAGATVLGFVDYWEAPPEKIQQRTEIFKKFHEMALQGKKSPQELMPIFKQMYELDLSLKTAGKRFTGGDPAWKATTDSEGNFEIKGIPPYKPQSMYDIMYEVLAFKDGYAFNSTGSAQGLGGVQVQIPKLEFALYLEPNKSEVSCNLSVQNFSGQNFSYPTKMVQEITSWLIKNHVDQDEVVLLKDFPIDQEYNYDGSKEKNQKLFASKLSDLSSQFPGIHFVGAHPQSKKIKIPLDAKNSYEEDRFTGYHFSSALNQYLLIQETCILPIKSPPPQLEQEPHYGSIREVFPPFIKTKNYFKQIEENLENMNKMPQK